MAVFGFKVSQMVKPKSLAIVEKDQSFMKVVSSFAEKCGFVDISTFASADELWKACADKTFDMMILDWGAGGGLSGLAFYNRVRSDERFALTPIVVTTGFVEKGDFSLLKEFPVTALIEKPFIFALFQEEVKKIWSEYQWYGANEEQVTKLVNHSGDNTDELLKELGRVTKDSPNPIPLSIMLGRMFLEKRKLKTAEAIFRKVLKQDESNAAAMNEIAKILFQVGYNKEALEVLQAAQKLSPGNIERICFMGQVELAQNNTENASAHFDSALKIDKESDVAKAGKVLVKNAKDFFKQRSEKTDASQSFASFMNTIGIAKVRKGNINEGLKHYVSCMKFLTLKEDKAKVAFNLGLGYMRNKDFKAAMEWFEKAGEYQGGKFNKAEKYLQALSRKIASGANDPDLTGLSLEEERIEVSEKTSETTVDLLPVNKINKSNKAS
jgi:tetratricopeptide (TPR) repeat protein